ncbi:MAG: hypothetical protein HZB18_10010 [Chloroflexi bacterium]|nr:hypothetical protein [Chloroflexota bacterium]
MIKNRKFPFVFSLLFWLFLSIFPWQRWLEGLDLLRFALGMLVYLIPGMAAFLVWTGEEQVSARTLLGGFVTVVFVTGLLGVIARFFQLNFLFIRWVFALWGAVMVTALWFRPLRVTWQFEKTTWWESLLLLISAGGAVYFSALASPPLIHDDAFTYSALLYYFQHAPALTFDFPDSLSRLEIPRFWLAYWPLVEAMISGLSGVDGLFITGTLLPPLLAGFSFLAVFTLAQTLGLPRVVAGAAVLAQGFSLMRLTRNNQPGYLFFQKLTEDKVTAAFVISLVLIILVVEYFQNPTNRKLFIIWVTAMGMVFTHPVQFGMACMIAGAYGLPSLFKKELRWKFFQLIGILAVVVLLPYSFRFFGGEYSQTLSFSMDDVIANDELARLGIRRIDYIEGTNYYGISRYLTVGLPYEIGALAAIVSLFFFWKHNSARYVLASFLVLGVSMLPYTGWIVGMFTTPFQLWRLTWLTPFGMAFAFLLWAGLDIVQKIRPLEKINKCLPQLAYFSAYVLLIAAVLYVREWTLGNVEKSNQDVVGFYNNYVSAARKMNQLNAAGNPIIVGGPDAVTHSIIPSLTLNYIPLVFRVETGGPQTQLWKSIVGEDIPAEVRLARLKENRVGYLLLKGEVGWVIELMDRYPEQVDFIFRDQRFSLYKLTY